MTMRSSIATALAGAACLAGLALAPAALRAQSQPVQLQAAGSEIVFVTRQMGVPVQGRFGRFNAQIALDPRKPEAGSVSFTIDTASARFGSAEVDAEVPKATWLNVAQFPQASFQSASIKAIGAGRFEVAGRLSLKGSVRELVVPVQITQAGAASSASGQFTIKRIDFKVGEAEWADTSMLANDVQVRFKLALAGLAPL
jgi:polyisoprenoid-binding protein YceI